MNQRADNTYDFREYDRVWQRVLPTLDPWGMNDSNLELFNIQPAVTTEPVSNTEPAVNTEPVITTEPAVDTVPACTTVSECVTVPACTTVSGCMNAMEIPPLLAQLIEEELSQRQRFSVLFRHAPVWARPALREFSNGALSRVRSLTTAYYLITGTRYECAVDSAQTAPEFRPASGRRTESGERNASGRRTQRERWCPELRNRYHALTRTALAYAQIAEETRDPCLSRLLGELSVDAFAQASGLLRLLERSLSMSAAVP